MRPCPYCAKSIEDQGQVCPFCNTNLAAPPAAPGFQFTPPLGNQETSGKAIASLVCGILFFFLPSAIAAVIMGHLSLSDIRRNAGRLGGQGMAIAGLVLGYAGLAILPILIIAAIAIPNLLRSRMAANEASAVASLRTSRPSRDMQWNARSRGIPQIRHTWSWMVLARALDPKKAWRAFPKKESCR